MFAVVSPSITVQRAADALAEVDGATLSDDDRVQLLTDLEKLKSAAAAAQARVTATFVA